MDSDFKPLSPGSAGQPSRATRPSGLIDDVMPVPATPPTPATPAAPSPEPVTPADTPTAAGQPTTSIKFHVPGVHPDDNAPPEESKDYTTFDRDAPPPVAPRSSNPVSKGRQGLRDVLSIGGVLVSALLLAFCLITFVFQSYQVDGPSMQTTLQNGDHLIVWKVPKSIANLTHSAYIPHRGDVIVFNEPNLSDYGQDNGKQLIKRVIGLPGERVVVKNGSLTVYNKERPKGFQPDQELPYGKVITTTTNNVDITVGENQVFVCGDNRTNSLDSRVFGPIDASNIVGKLVLRVLPLNEFKKF